MAALALHTALLVPDPEGVHLEEELGQVYREVRVNDPAVWRFAARRLGEQAAASRGAFAILRGLLTSPSLELRLRGVVSLQGLAGRVPRQVARFLRDRLGEADTWQDPVLLDAVMEVGASLPAALRNPLLTDCLRSPRAVVRASACSILARRAEAPWDLLEAMTRDPSVEVRAALAAALQDAPLNRRRDELLEKLAEGPEPELRMLLGKPVQGAASFRAHPAVPPGELSRAALERLEDALDQAPRQALDLLRETMGLRSAPRLLEHLESLARNRAVAALCRALGVLLQPDVPDRDRLLRVVGTLETVADEDPVRDLYLLSSLCLHALEVDSLEGVSAWAERRKLEEMVRDLWSPTRVGSETAQALGNLASLGELAANRSLFTLSQAGERLQQGLAEVESECSPPESLLLAPAYRRWVELIDQEIQGLMGDEP